ncbi:cytochrome c-type biogenesis protein CcmH [Uliginosibacterium sp. 31-16]|uniref:cytochrome c-type biogenesis protein n=1 Tax=Uliginosibacterium sp. 31-16 TaxID=3068315 RepID=UPI00273D6FEF|nr:cytochrome c-type biogenesis protein [Uliginosibacterium sp. 31-16]MDP5239201.1 cytochrome c-type biogenesis protein CcmH [Uliginosibacterium sp. 31-16]
MAQRLIRAICIVFFSVSAFAATPEATVDARATRLEEQLRCLVCQNQSIAESQADLAMDLKRQVHEMLAAGKSEAEVRDFMVERYGDFVLYDPPLKTGTLILWLGPLLLVLGALAAFFWRLRQRRSEPAEAVPDAAALARARALLDKKES